MRRYGARRASLVSAAHRRSPFAAWLGAESHARRQGSSAVRRRCTAASARSPPPQRDHDTSAYLSGASATHLLGPTAAWLRGRKPLEPAGLSGPPSAGSIRRSARFRRRCASLGCVGHASPRSVACWIGAESRLRLPASQVPLSAGRCAAASARFPPPQRDPGTSAYLSGALASPRPIRRLARGRKPRAPGGLLGPLSAGRSIGSFSTIPAPGPAGSAPPPARAARAGLRRWLSLPLAAGCRCPLAAARNVAAWPLRTTCGLAAPPVEAGSRRRRRGAWLRRERTPSCVAKATPFRLPSARAGLPRLRSPELIT